MKLLKALIVTLSAVLLTGCYTQLQFTERMHRITEERDGRYSQTNDQEKRVDDSEYYGDEYIPVYYKDYEYAESWAECGCNPYRDYYFYDGYSPYNSWYHYRPYYSSHYYYDWNPFWPWRHHRYFGNTFAFSISFHWGNPYYHSFFYDPFYSPFYHYPYGYGLRPVAFNYFYFYNNSGYGYYDGNDRVVDENRRYGLRNIGSSRVSDNTDRVRVRGGRTKAVIGRTNSDRSRSAVRSRSVGTSRNEDAIRTRSSSVTRSRGSNDYIVRTRSRSNDQSSRLRNRDNQQRINSRSTQSVERYRSIRQADDKRSNIIRRRMIDYSSNRQERIEYRNRIKERLRSQMVPTSDYDIYERIQRDNPIFFQRLRSFFDSNSSRISNQNSRSVKRAIHTRTPSSSRSINRRSSNDRSSVTRSRSSSSHSRSRGSSSRSRSRSSGSDSSDRSRGNN